jgi:hypothetical protein
MSSTTKVWQNVASSILLLFKIIYLYYLLIFDIKCRLILRMLKVKKFIKQSWPVLM